MTWFVLASAFWLGILTSISPCPLATNIAAISFVSRHVGRPRKVAAAGLLYIAGRTIAYVFLAAFLLAGLLARDVTARFLQRYLNLVIGPVLILVGMLLLGLLGTAVSLTLAGERVQRRVAEGSAWWAGVLGFLFALSFCPVSAGLYFGTLLPLAAANGSRFVLPALYGVGTALPVVAFAFLIAFASEYVGRAFDRLRQVERRLRIVTGIVLVGAGIYLSLTHVYGLSLPPW